MTWRLEVGFGYVYTARDGSEWIRCSTCRVLVPRRSDDTVARCLACIDGLKELGGVVDPTTAFNAAGPFEDPPEDPDNLYFQTEGDPLAGWCRVIRGCDDGNPNRVEYRIRFPSPEWEETGSPHAIRRKRGPK